METKYATAFFSHNETILTNLSPAFEQEKYQSGGGEGGREAAIRNCLRSQFSGIVRETMEKDAMMGSLLDRFYAPV